jgi:Carbonic anhydrase
MKGKMKKTGLMIIALFVLSEATIMAAEPEGMPANDALKRLQDGNAKFVAASLTGLNGQQLLARRAELTKDQKPFAVIVSCSDSRVPPELVFDAGLGDVFVVRTAGEVVDPVAIGSIEYAVAHLGTNLIVVLGHEKCGAVAAAVSQAKESGNIPDVLKAIEPAVEETKGKPGDPVDNAVRANAVDIARRLETTGPIIPSRVKAGTLKIVAARYDLDSGKVELFQ